MYKKIGQGRKEPKVQGARFPGDRVSAPRSQFPFPFVPSGSSQHHRKRKGLASTSTLRLPRLFVPGLRSAMRGLGRLITDTCLFWANVGHKIPGVGDCFAGNVASKSSCRRTRVLPREPKQPGEAFHRVASESLVNAAQLHPTQVQPRAGITFNCQRTQNLPAKQKSGLPPLTCILLLFWFGLRAFLRASFRKHPQRLAPPGEPKFQRASVAGFGPGLQVPRSTGGALRQRGHLSPRPPGWETRDQGSALLQGPESHGLSHTRSTSNLALLVRLWQLFDNGRRSCPISSFW
jgi:hypothetical protein